jgi:hypothetical protein
MLTDFHQICHLLPILLTLPDVPTFFKLII